MFRQIVYLLQRVAAFAHPLPAPPSTNAFAGHRTNIAPDRIRVNWRNLIIFFSNSIHIYQFAAIYFSHTAGDISQSMLARAHHYHWPNSGAQMPSISSSLIAGLALFAIYFAVGAALALTFLINSIHITIFIVNLQIFIFNFAAFAYSIFIAQLLFLSALLLLILF